MKGVNRMFIQKIKKVVATLLILSLVLTSAGFCVFADSLDGAVYEKASGSEIKNYYEEATRTQVVVNDEDEQENDNDEGGASSVEPEDDFVASQSQLDEEDDSSNEVEDDGSASPSQIDEENGSREATELEFNDEAYEATESEFDDEAYEATESEIASESEIEISTNSQVKTKDENLFGAPPDYTLTNHWWSCLSITERQSATEITFIKGSYTPPAGASNYPIPNSDGLIAYYEPTNRIVIYAPTNNTIYASADFSHAFSAFHNIVNITNLSFLDTSNVTSMEEMFAYCAALTSLDLSSFNTSNVTNMYAVFGGCAALTSVNLSGFNAGNATDIASMFAGCATLTSVNLSGFNAANAISLRAMFAYCTALTSLDLSNFNAPSITDMSNAFAGLSALISLDLSNFNTSNVTNMEGLFWNCRSLTSINLSNFNTSNVTNMYAMFSNCIAITSLDLSSFNTSNVTNMARMFDTGLIGDYALRKIIVSSSFVTTAVTRSEDMFNGRFGLMGNRCTKLASVSGVDDKTYARIDGGVSNPGLLYDSNPGPVTLPDEIFMGTAFQAGGVDSKIFPPVPAGNWDEPVKWKVLFQDGHEALLVTDTANEYKIYSPLTFSPAELTAIKNTINPEEPTVEKKLFDLSASEARDLFVDSLGIPSETKRAALSNPYYHGVSGTDRIAAIVGEPVQWYLRGTTSVVHTDGRIAAEDSAAWGPLHRYAMYVDLYSPLFANGISNITWDLGTSSVIVEESFSDGWTSYIEGDGYDLPDEHWIRRAANNLPFYMEPSLISRSKINGFYIDTDSSKGTTIVTEIPTTQRGNITLRAVWESDLEFDLRGEGTWDPSFTPSSSFIEGEKINLPSSASVIANTVGREFDCWKVEPVEINNHSTNHWDNDPDIGKVVDENYTKNRKLALKLGAYFKNLKYDIKYNLGEGSFEDGYVAPSKYEFSAGLDLSQVINHINPPEDKEVDYIKVNGVKAASISTTTTGAVTIDVVYRGRRYPITWELNGSKWASGYIGTSSYVHGEGLVLPEASKLVLVDKKEFLCWAVNGKREEEISKTSTGAVTVTLIYTDTKTYGITWNLRGGHFIDYDAPDIYYEGVEYILPDGTEKVAPPKKVAFNQWVLNSADVITKIEKTSRGAVIIEAYYKKISGGGSGTSGGGGSRGGGGGYVNQLNNDLNFVLRTPIYENEYTWKYDDTGNKVGLTLDVNSLVAKAMMNSSGMKAAYRLHSDCKSIDIGGGGVYNIVEKGFNSFYGFDSKFELMTGFIHTSERTKILDVVESAVYGLGKTEDNGEKKVFFEQPHTEGKYYLFEDVGYCKGLLWNQPVVVGGYLYRFDVTGKVISTSDINVYQGFWEYNIGINKWRFLGVDRDGKVGYYKNGIYDILYNKEVLKYGFDSEGNVLTGTYELNGKTYTAYSTGALTGAILYD